MMKVFMLILLMIFSVAAAEDVHIKDDAVFWSDYPADALARFIVERMTDEELYSQALMFGWAGAVPSELLYQWVGRGLGSVKLFGWNTDNIERVAAAVSSLQSKAAGGRFSIPLFVATDQEGGNIRHVKGATTITPGSMAIGASAYPADAWYTGYYIAREIKALGINMNFAPSVDLFTNHQSQIIGPRSFGDDAQSVAALGAAFAAGEEEAGIIPCPKHFPGHGDTASDSHTLMPVIDIDTDTLTSREIVPFQQMVKASEHWAVSAMMSGHISFPRIEKSGAPASLSHLFLTDLLRGQLGFRGLIITDDLMMNGDTIYAGSLSNAFRMALEAGNDILISSTTAGLNEALWTNNLAEMRRNNKFKARVKDAAYRIIYAKLLYFKSENAAPLHPDPTTISNYIPDPAGDAFFLSMACRSITIAKGTAVNPSDAGRVLLAGSLAEFFRQGKSRYRDTGDYRFTFDAGPNETQYIRDHIAQIAAAYDTIVCLVSEESSRRIAQSLRPLAAGGKRVVIFSIMSPEYALDMDWASTILLGYGWSTYTMDAMFGALAGEYKAKGRLPYKR